MGTAALVIITLLVFLFLGVPVTWAIGSACVIACLTDDYLSMTVLSQKIFTGIDNFALLAIPAFFLAGDIMGKGGLSKRLVSFASALVGWIAGGISLVSIVACAFFAAISGSSVATTAGIGGIMYPEMVKRGYPKAYSAAVQAVGGTLGIVIPPSIVFVVYGNITGVPVGDLLMSGLLPGFFTCAALCVYGYLKAKRNNYPKESNFSGIGLLKSFKTSVWALLMPFIILGGIYAGIFTPTESATIAVVYGTIVCLFVYREIGLRDVWAVLKKTATGTATLMLLVVTAQLFGYLLTYYRIPVYVSEWFISVAKTPATFMLMIILLLIICGMFLEVGATNLILGPILAPIAVQFGINPIHFGLVFVFLLAMGQATPPFGTTMFVACGISGVPVSKIIRQLIPLVLIEVVCAVIFAFVPAISTFLPGLMN